MDLSKFDETQKLKIHQLREAIKDCNLHDSSDYFFLSWLIARNFDLLKAEIMLRNSLDWRAKNRVNTIREEFKSPEVILKYQPVAPIGYDKKFNTLWLARRGLEDTKGMLSSVLKSELIKHLIKQIETGIWLGKQFRRRSQIDGLIQMTIIIDMEGFSFTQLTYKPAIDLSSQLIQIYQDNYPELLHRVFIINAPKIFNMALSILKPFMDERTVNKILIYGYESEVWKRALLSEINADQLPACYGGTMVDPDGNPYCATKCSMGGLVDKSYYLSNHCKLVNNNFDLDSMTSFVLPAKCKKHFKFHVDSCDQTLRWSFFSKNGDVSFAVYYINEINNITTSIIPPSRVDSDIICIHSEIRCEESGMYIVEFDNSFSFMRSKRIWYSITVEELK